MESLKGIIQQLIGGKIIRTTPVGGGCMAHNFCLQTTKGKYFLKYYSQEHCKQGILAAEVRGLQELTASKSVTIPQIITHTSEFLLLEWIETGKKKKDFWFSFASSLVKMHKCYGKSFGFEQDNFIGTTVQKNTPTSDNWASFFYSHRLLFQYQLAEKNNLLNDEIKNLFSDLETKVLEYLHIDQQPSLLHGDLWSGNFLIGSDGYPVVIDPAVYYGHRESDFAMMYLFGGFDPSFYQHYQEIFPFEKGWEKRLNFYKLYHVFNHLNLSGVAYRSQVAELLRVMTQY